jgi:hypothetical protein
VGESETIFAQALCTSRTVSKICEFSIESPPKSRYAQAAHTGEVLIFEMKMGYWLMAISFWLMPILGCLQIGKSR